MLRFPLVDYTKQQHTKNTKHVVISRLPQLTEGINLTDRKTT